jgi:hypothetical protein
MMPVLGKVLQVSGIVPVAAVVLLIFSGRLPWLGRLPGDIAIVRGNFWFYAPITTCVVVSVIISLVLRAIAQLRK